MSIMPYESYDLMVICVAELSIIHNTLFKVQGGILLKYRMCWDHDYVQLANNYLYNVIVFILQFITLHIML